MIDQEMIDQELKQEPDQKMMEQYIKNFIKNVRHSFSKIESQQDMISIYQLLKYGKINKITSAQSNHYFGYYYYTKSNYNQMMHYLKTAIRLGCHYSMFALGNYYQKHVSILVPSSFDKKMMKYYDMATKRGNTLANGYLGFYYLNTKDTHKGLEILKSSADSKNYFSAIVLIIYYYKQKNIDQMIKYADIIGNNEDMYNSQLRIAKYYESINDFDQMIKYYEPIIQSNNTDAMISLALYYSKSDPDKKLKYLKMANKLGNHQATRFLGIFYEQTLPEKSLKYHQKAMNMGNKYSLYHLVTYYISERDHKKVFTYLDKYVKLQDKHSIYLLSNYYKKIKDNDQMLKYLYMASSRGSFHALNDLSDYHYTNGDFDYMKACQFMSLDIFFSIYLFEKMLKYCDTNDDFDHLYNIFVKYSSKCNTSLFFNNLLKIIKDNKYDYRLLEILTLINSSNPNYPKELTFLTNCIKKKINIIDLHFTYAPGPLSKSFINSQKDFSTRAESISQK